MTNECLLSECKRRISPNKNRLLLPFCAAHAAVEGSLLQRVLLTYCSSAIAFVAAVVAVVSR